MDSYSAMPFQLTDLQRRSMTALQRWADGGHTPRVHLAGRNGPWWSCKNCKRALNPYPGKCK